MRSSRIPKKVRTLNNPVIAHHYPELCDFGKFRDVNWIEVDQIWHCMTTTISCQESMLEYITLIHPASKFSSLGWLEHKAMNAQEAKWTDQELPVARRSLCLGETCIVEGSRKKIGNILIHSKIYVYIRDGNAEPRWSATPKRGTDVHPVPQTTSRSSNKRDRDGGVVENAGARQPAIYLLHRHCLTLFCDCLLLFIAV